MAIDLEADMDDIFLQCGFEETVWYHAQGAATGLEMSAIVFREGYTESPKFNNSSVRKYKISILVSPDTTTGVTQVTTQEDYFTLYEKKGDTTTKKYHVKGIIYNDDGGFMLGLG